MIKKNQVPRREKTFLPLIYTINRSENVKHKLQILILKARVWNHFASFHPNSCEKTFRIMVTETLTAKILGGHEQYLKYSI